VSAPTGADPEQAAAVGARPASPRRERMLSELAAEIRGARAAERRDVTELQAELGRITALLGENADLLAQTLPRVTALDVALADLAARVDDLTAATPRAGEATVDWPALSAPDAASEWEALATWVADVLGPFYQLTRAQLPDCWALHPPAVIELIWLRRTYVAAHAPDAAPSAAGEWHTRWRRDALTNIAVAIPTTWCRPGEHYLHEHDRDRHYRDHRPDQPPGPPAPDQDQPTPGRRPGPADLRIGLVGEITSPRHWGPAYQLAVAADLDWRRARDAAGGGPAPGG
jgi:hypothetical protein